MKRQSLNVFRMNILGAKCVPVHAGSKTLKDAINEAMRDWVTNVDTTHYIVGSAIGPHPFPVIVRDLQVGQLQTLFPHLFMCSPHALFTHGRPLTKFPRA